MDWLAHLGIAAGVESYLGTADVGMRTLLRRPVEILESEWHLRALGREAASKRLLISRSMGPFTRGLLEADLLARSGWGVYDFDDALWADSRPGVHKVFARSTTWHRSVVSADQVIAGNDYLAEAASRLNRNVVVIPSCVEPEHYAVKRTYAVGPVPRLVWMGSPATERYLQSISPALLTVHELTGARLTLISGGQRRLGELEVMTDRVPWTGPSSFGRLAEADVGIMPLPDDQFARGKCAYKLLQYGASGLPVVASPVGMNVTVIEQFDGLAAESTDEWTEALLAMLGESSSRRQQRGVRARRALVTGYSFSAWRDAFLDALRLSPNNDRGSRTSSPGRTLDLQGNH